MLRTIRNLTAVVLATAVCLAFSASPASAAGKGKRAAGTHGKILSISASELDLQTGGKKNPQTLKIKIDKTTTVDVDGKSGDTSLLKPGDRVAVTMSGDVASKIVKSAHKARGAKAKKKATT